MAANQWCTHTTLPNLIAYWGNSCDSYLGSGGWRYATQQEIQTLSNLTISNGGATQSGEPGSNGGNVGQTITVQMLPAQQTLTLSEVQELTFAVVAAWAAGWAIRFIRQQLTLRKS